MQDSMAELNPLKAGDVPYPQYSVTTTEPIFELLQILKGVVYTKDPAGFLVPVVATLAKGIFQAKATPTTIPVSSGDDSVQVLTPRTRMIFNDVAGGLVTGDDVIVVADTTNIIAGAKSSDLYIGKVFEIYTKDAQGTKKIVAGAGDLVIVETVGP